MRRGRLGLLLVASIALGCAAHRPEAGTGDVAFRLLWNGVSDLDLVVREPAGGCIHYGQRESPAGGRLDIDCNAGSGRICERPIENVFWPAGSAPAGTYAFWVHAHSLVPAEAPLEFEIQVLRGPRVSWRQTIFMKEHTQTYGPWEYEFPSGDFPGGKEIARHRKVDSWRVGCRTSNS